MQNTPQTPQAAKPKPPRLVAPPEFQADRIIKLGEPELIAILKNPKSTEFEKAKACQRLATVGTEAAAPALAALLADPKLATYARFGLQPLPGTASDDALRAALPKLKGNLLIGVVNSIAHRKDAKAIPALTKMMYDADPAVAQAAASAVGHISGAEASKALQTALAKTKGPVRVAVADACLVCAEGLLAGGDRPGALALYQVLTAPDVPKPQRLASMHSIISTEVSLTRPR